MLTNRQLLAKGILEALCSDRANLDGIQVSAEHYKVDPALFTVQTALNMADILLTLTTVKKPKPATDKPKRTRRKIKDAAVQSESMPNGYR